MNTKNILSNHLVGVANIIRHLLSVFRGRKLITNSLLFMLLALMPACNSKKYTVMAVYPLEEEIELQAGASGTVAIKIEILENHYIYGNPKGPGIGKETTVEIEHPDRIIFSDPKFMPAKQYTPSGFKKFVWIYRDQTEIEIPFNVKEDIKAGAYKIKIFVQALLCSESSCTLRNFTIEYLIRVTPANRSVMSSSVSSKSEVALEKDATEGKEGKSISKKVATFQPRYISSSNIVNIIQAILYGLLAGFILNFMPCVLPVISLKIMDIVKHAGEDKRELVKLGSLFTFGILITFVVLAILAAFLGYNYGALFQKKIFLVIMIAVLFALTLSLFEVFTINIPSIALRATDNFGRRASDSPSNSHDSPRDKKSNQYLDAFGKGILSTLLGTPCSGPFLGGTLAWAFTQTPAVIFIIFISVGMGMAMPYIILTINTNFVKYIPKSGNWMIAFERIMAFLLMATIIYLIGILEYHYIMPTLWFLLFVAIAFWQYGKFGSVIMKKKKRIISKAALVLIVLFGYFFSYDYLYSREEKKAEFNEQVFNMAELYENKDNGSISIIDFTADWCPNCKLVENTSLHTSRIFKAIKDNKIELYVADLTRENVEAEKLLKDLGSRSIPFLAVFPAGDSFFQPLCLRDIYSEKDVLKAIKMATQISSH